MMEISVVLHIIRTRVEQIVPIILNEWWASREICCVDHSQLTDLSKRPPETSLSRFHAALEGQSASTGRLRRKVLLANSERGQSGSNVVRPDLFKNVLRST
jgi:hypothetical protein